MTNIQILNDALMTVAFVIGAAFVLTVAMVTASALWQRQSRGAGLYAVERHLAAVTEETSPADAR